MIRNRSRGPWNANGTVPFAGSSPTQTRTACYSDTTPNDTEASQGSRPVRRPALTGSTKPESSVEPRLQASGPFRRRQHTDRTVPLECGVFAVPLPSEPGSGRTAVMCRSTFRPRLHRPFPPKRVESMAPAPSLPSSPPVSPAEQVCLMAWARACWPRGLNDPAWRAPKPKPRSTPYTHRHRSVGSSNPVAPPAEADDSAEPESTFKTADPKICHILTAEPFKEPFVPGGRSQVGLHLAMHCNPRAPTHPPSAAFGRNRRLLAAAACDPLRCSIVNGTLQPAGNLTRSSTATLPEGAVTKALPAARALRHLPCGS
jgi:hypothetical protein